MVTQAIKRSSSGFYALIAVPLMLSGCFYGDQKQFFSSNQDEQADHSDHHGNGNGGPGGSNCTPTPAPSATPGTRPSTTPTATPTASGTPYPTATPVASGTPTGGGGYVQTAMANQKFAIVSSQIKKIDFLFVVDNSGSMADKQHALAAGFEKFANTFYRRADLDICTMIITSDRYLGKSSGSYQRERSVGCTKPAGWESWSDAQMNAYIDSLIADFKNKVNVGTNGSGTELLGKSLVTYLYSLAKWGNAINPSVHASFFRPDAVANISFLTDENNYFVKSNVSESANDLPAVTDSVIYNSQSGAVDHRKGIKNYLDDFFASVNPQQGASYSIVSLLEERYSPNPSVDNSPALAKNLSEVVSAVGRESSHGDIEGGSSVYASVYTDIADALVTRATAFNLSHDLYEPNFPSLQDLKVQWVQSSGNVVLLNLGSDYEVQMPNGIVLHSNISGNAQAGDQLSVDYRYKVQ